MNQKISKLSENYRIPLILKDIEGMPIDRIAEVLDIPSGTVKSRIQQGTKTIARIFTGFLLRERRMKKCNRLMDYLESEGPDISPEILKHAAGCSDCSLDLKNRRRPLIIFKRRFRTRNSGWATFFHNARC